MSAANAAAIRRRVNNQNGSQIEPPVSKSTTSATATSQAGLTLPQVISNLDVRIKSLETNIPAMNGMDTIFSSGVIDEFNSRFEILANELADIKDIILKLQTFTMEVNKTMHDERIHILSEVGNASVSNSINDINHEEPSSPTSVSIKDMAQEELAKVNY